MISAQSSVKFSAGWRTRKNPLNEATGQPQGQFPRGVHFYKRTKSSPQYFSDRMGRHPQKASSYTSAHSPTRYGSSGMGNNFIAFRPIHPSQNMPPCSKFVPVPGTPFGFSPQPTRRFLAQTVFPRENINQPRECMNEHIRPRVMQMTRGPQDYVHNANIGQGSWKRATKSSSNINSNKHYYMNRQPHSHEIIGGHFCGPKVKLQTSSSSLEPQKSLHSISEKDNEQSEVENTEPLTTDHQLNGGASKDKTAGKPDTSIPSEIKVLPKTQFSKPQDLNKNNKVRPGVNSLETNCTPDNNINKPHKKLENKDIERNHLSGSLKRVSPFESYRRSKSKELGVTVAQLTKSSNDSIEDPAERSKSPFEKAKLKIAQKCVPDQNSETIEQMNTSDAKEMKSSARAGKDVSTNVRIVISEPDKSNPSRRASITVIEEDTPVPPNSSGAEEFEESTNPSKSDKSKSMCKRIASKFTRSLSNVGEESLNQENGKKNSVNDSKVPSNAAIKSKESKGELKPETVSVKLHRSRDKSPAGSNLSLCKDSQSNENSKDNEKVNNTGELPTSKRISTAFNKFFGRNDENFRSIRLFPRSASSLSTQDRNAFSEQINSNKDREEIVSPSNKQPTNVTNNIKASKYPQKFEANAQSCPVDGLNSNTDPTEIRTNTGENSSNIYTNTNTLPTSSVSNRHAQQNNKELFARANSCNNANHLPAPRTTNVSDSQSSDRDEDEDESVMDRVTRKSYYTRFNDHKRKPNPVRTDNKEAIDQQLAAAKARLMSEEIHQPQNMFPHADILQHDIPHFNTVPKRERKYVGPRITSMPPNEDFSRYVGLTTNYLPCDPQELQFDPNFSHTPMVPRYVYSPISDEQLPNYDPLSPHATGYSRSDDRWRTISPINHSSNYPYKVCNMDNAYSPNNIYDGHYCSHSLATMPTSNKSPTLFNGVHSAELPSSGYGQHSQGVNVNLPQRDFTSPQNQYSQHIPTTNTSLPPNDVITAREELKKRLTPLTKLSNSKEGGLNKYQRSLTASKLNLPESEPENKTVRKKPYRKANTSWDITNTAQKPTDFRWILQSPKQTPNVRTINNSRFG